MKGEPAILRQEKRGASGARILLAPLCFDTRVDKMLILASQVT